MMKKASILVRLPRHLKDRFQVAVAEQGQPSMTWIINALVEEFVVKHEDETLEHLSRAYYLCRLRPPGCAQVPEGFAAFSAWEQPQESSLGAEGVRYHGWVSYAEELTEEQTTRFALERVGSPPL